MPVSCTTCLGYFKYTTPVPSSQFCVPAVFKAGMAMAKVGPAPDFIMRVFMALLDDVEFAAIAHQVEERADAARAPVHAFADLRAHQRKTPLLAEGLPFGLSVYQK
jgi:hypothetical protein